MEVRHRIDGLESQTINGTVVPAVRHRIDGLENHAKPQPR